MRWWTSLVLVIAAAVARPAAAQADEGDLPAGNWGIFLGARNNLGDLGKSYGFGLFFGFLAHYHPTHPGQAFSLGLGWSTTIYGRFGADDPMIADTPLLMVEMSAGPRLRRSLGEAPRFLVLSGGGAIQRVNVPVPPDDKRLYVGGYGALGYEQYLGAWLLSLETRYGLIGAGPRSVSFMVGFGRGS